MKKIKESKALTLLALVITIVILLILAGVSISMVNGKGLMGRAKDSKSRYETSADIEELKLRQFEYEMDKEEGNTKRQDGTVITFLEWLEARGEYTVQYEDEEHLKATITMNSGRVYYIEVDEDDIDIEGIGSVGKIVPRIKSYEAQSNSDTTITVKVKLTKSQENDNISFKYVILNSNGNVLETKNVTDKEVTFTGLSPDNEYTVNITATNENGEVERVVETRTLKKIDSPTINVSGSGSYPLLTEYGVVGHAIYIEFEDNPLLTNYYSWDGTNWTEYTGALTTNIGESKTIYAKSVMQDNQDYHSDVVSQTVSTSSGQNAMGGNAFDNNLTSAESFGYGAWRQMLVDSSMQGKLMQIRMRVMAMYAHHPSIQVFRADGSYIQTLFTITDSTYNDTFKVTLPSDAALLKFFTSSGEYHSEMDIYEIGPSGGPVLTDRQYFPKVTETGVDQGYTMVSISYFSTSVQKLYKIDNESTWHTYNNTPVRLELGQTLYAKGIDAYDTETEITHHTATLIDGALKVNAYDGSTSSADSFSKNETRKILIDSSMQGKLIEFDMKVMAMYAHHPKIDAYRADNTFIETLFTITDSTYDDTYKVTLPSDVAYIKFITTSGEYYSAMDIYEIGPSGGPVLTGTQYYPVISTNGVNPGYSMVNIEYFNTSVQRLYKINNESTWHTYSNTPVRVEIGQTLYAKGINASGEETEITNYTATLINGALNGTSYDGNTTTGEYFDWGASRRILVDPAVQEQQIGINMKVMAMYAHHPYIAAYSSNGTLLDTLFTITDSTYEGTYYMTIPDNTAYLSFVTTSGEYHSEMTIYEINS